MFARRYRCRAVVMRTRLPVLDARCFPSNQHHIEAPPGLGYSLGAAPRAPGFFVARHWRDVFSAILAQAALNRTLGPFKAKCSLLLRAAEPADRARASAGRVTG